MFDKTETIKEDTTKENVTETRPPIEWYEKELKDCRNKINNLYVENQRLKETIVYLSLKLKDKEDTLIYLVQETN